MTAKEMFEKLGYEEFENDKSFIQYRDDSHGDGDYAFVRFNHMWKEYETGYYDGYETKNEETYTVSIELHQAITQQMKELGWIE